MKRLCAYFDDESTAIIEKYEKKYGGSTAALLRRALQCLKNHEEAQEKTSWEHIVAYVDFLAKMEHVIVDIAHWKSIFTENPRLIFSLTCQARAGAICQKAILLYPSQYTGLPVSGGNAGAI